MTLTIQGRDDQYRGNASLRLWITMNWMLRQELNSKSPTSQILKFSYFQVYVLQEFLLMLFVISYHSNPSNSFIHLQRLGWSPSVHSDSAASSRHPLRGDQSIRGWSRSDDDSDGCRPARTRCLRQGLSQQHCSQVIHLFISQAGRRKFTAFCIFHGREVICNKI